MNTKKKKKKFNKQQNTKPQKHSMMHYIIMLSTQPDQIKIHRIETVSFEIE